MSEANGANGSNGNHVAAMTGTPALSSAGPTAARGDAEIPPVPAPTKKQKGPTTRCSAALTKLITDSIKMGNYFETACKAQGLSPVTARDWLMRGKKDRVEMRRSPYATFHEEVEKAHALGESSLVSTLRVHAQKDYRPALEMLARKFPKRWGKTVELSTAPDATPNTPYAGRSDADLKYFIEHGHWPEEAP